MDAPQRRFRILPINIGRAAIILSSPENLQRVYRPLSRKGDAMALSGKPLSVIQSTALPEFSAEHYCLGRAILLCADKGWRCPLT